MKQILQNLKNGQTELVDVPCPIPSNGEVLLRTQHTLISAGTERMLVEFGKANWLAKARQQPDKVQMVLQKMRTDGLMATWEAVQNKLDQPLALGYCHVGTVQALGHGIPGLAVGDRVVSNARHAEMVCVPKNLCVKIPDAVCDESAVFTVLAAIGLQGIRLAMPAVGECVAVSGLGLIGLLTVQMLRAQGCRVLGIDHNPARRALAEQWGAETVSSEDSAQVLAHATVFSRGRGMDAVLITAATPSSEPVRVAARISRQRGRIVLVGVTGLSLSRAEFYEKELSFQVSCSYGPGRYDSAYEQEGHDYPVGFVRWTEQRNFEAVLDLMASGALQVAPLISHRFELEQAEQAYALLGSNQPSLGIVLNYPVGTSAPLARTLRIHERKKSTEKTRIAVLGAGNYAGGILIPAFAKAGAGLQVLVSSSGVSAVHQGKKYGFTKISTDAAAAIHDPDVNAVVVATRHDSHAHYVLQAVQAGKHVYCEKPLCLNEMQLQEIEVACQSKPESLLMLGFNRRFSVHTQKIKQLLARHRGPKCFVMQVNAGMIPGNHWAQDPAVGGGRILGEACHFIDLLRYLADSSIVSYSKLLMASQHGDTATLNLQFADGSIGTVHYFANGHKHVPKERLEIFSAGSVLQLDNFRALVGFGWPGFRRLNSWHQDKGQTACVAAFVQAVQFGAPAPIALQEILEVSRVSIALA